MSVRNRRASTATSSALPVPMLQLRLPKEIVVPVPGLFLIPLKDGDFKLTWLAYFKKHCKDLHDGISSFPFKDKLGLSDNRQASDRQYWTLKNTVEEFINSFGRNRQLYNATLKINSEVEDAEPQPEIEEIRLPPMPISSGPNPGPSSASTVAIPGPSNGVASAKGRGKTTPTSTGGRKRKAPLPSSYELPLDQDTDLSLANTSEGTIDINASTNGGIAVASTSAGHKKKSFIPSSSSFGLPPPQQSARPVYEEESWALALPEPRKVPRCVTSTFNSPTMNDDDSIASQDSQPVNIVARPAMVGQVKADILNRIQKSVDNRSLTLVKDELQNAMNGKRWWDVVPKIPMTMNLLMMVFALNPTPVENQDHS